jgi:hypothetical protein
MGSEEIGISNLGGKPKTKWENDIERWKNTL